MQKITIRTDGIFFSFWDEVSASWINKNINESDFPISHYLPHITQVEGPVTIRDFLTHLSHYRNHIQLIFANALSGITCDQIIAAVNSPIQESVNAPMNFIYLFKIGEAVPISNGDSSYLNNYSVIMGLFVEEGSEEDEVYHLSAFEINQWIDTPVILDNFIEYTDVQNDEVILEGLADWKFFEVIHTILSQISLTVQVKKMTSSIEIKKLESGPMLISELFSWFDELDKIFDQ